MNATVTAPATAVEAQAQEVTIETVVAQLQLIDVTDKHQLSPKNIAEKLNELIAAVQQLQKANVPAGTVARDRGPKSEKVMTEEDARLVMVGEMKDVPHKQAAEKLGLSYGQVYSARKGFTFKNIYKEMKNGTVS